MMFKKYKRSFVSHQLGKLPTHLNNEQTNKLIQEIFDNEITEEHIQKLFNGHLKLAVCITGQYVNFLTGKGKNLFDVDDLLEEAIKAILETLLEMSIKINLEEYNFSAHCTVKIHAALIRFIRNNCIIKHDHKKQAITIHPLLTVTKVKEDYNLTNLEIQELIEKIALTEQEKKVLELRLQNYKNKEIGEELGVSESLVKKIRAILKRRYRIFINKL